MGENEKKFSKAPLEEPRKAQNGMSASFSAWQLSWELGYTIAIPIVLFALLGRWADKQFETSPWLLLAGIVVSITISSVIVYRKVSKIIK